jgi:hypothetical protein
VENSNSVLLNGAVLVLILISVPIILIALRVQKSRRFKRLMEEAEARSWHFESLAKGAFRIQGVLSSGLAWTSETMRMASPSVSDADDVTYHTRWSSQAISLPDRLVLIGPKMRITGNLPTTLGGGGMAGNLVRTFLRRFFGADADRLAGMSELQVGSEAFQRRYMVLAHDIHDAHRLLNVDVEAALTNWPKGQLAIKLGGSELSILFLNLKITKMAQVEQIVNLGDRLVMTWQSSR